MRRSLKVGLAATCERIVGGRGRDDATGTDVEAGWGAPATSRVGRRMRTRGSS